MRREERVTVQGPVKEQQPDGMSHRGLIRAGPVCVSGQRSENEAYRTVDQHRTRGARGGGTGARRGQAPREPTLFVCAQGIQHPVGHHWGP